MKDETLPQNTNKSYSHNSVGERFRNILPAYGDLQVVEVYFYYDGPKLFSLYSKTKDTYFLVFMVADENKEGEESETLLYLPLSPKDFELAINGKRDLYDSFKFSKTGTAWAVTYNYSISYDIPSIEEKAVNAISKDWLPYPDTFLGDEPE